MFICIIFKFGDLLVGYLYKGWVGLQKRIDVDLKE